MTQASTQAYHSEANKKSRVRHKDIVFEAIKRGPKSVNQICQETGLTYSAVMKRVPDLADEGLIYPVDEKDHQSVWALVIDEQKEWARRRREALKFYAWKKRGLKDFAEKLPKHVVDWLESETI